MSKDGFGISHLKDLPTTIWYAVLVVIALLGLALLRHFSFSTNVEA